MTHSTNHEGPPIKRIGFGDSQHSEAAALVEILRAATTDYVSSHPDPRVAMSILMSAAQMFSGTMFGTLLYMGELEQRQTARAAKMASLNFREGIKAGLKRATRIGAETGIRGAVQ